MSVTEDLRHLLTEHGGLIDNLCAGFPAAQISITVNTEADVAKAAAHAGVEVKHTVTDYSHMRGAYIRHGSAVLVFDHTTFQEPTMLRGAMRPVEAP